MRWLIGFILLCSFSGAVHALVINEIMYNPDGTDESHEWIELHNNGEFALNLETWSLSENNAMHSFNLVQGSLIVAPSQFVIIADDALQFMIDYPDYSSNLYDTSWTSLSNTGEVLSVLNEKEETVDLVNYTSAFGNGNGKSTERFSYGWNDSNAFGGSPGKENNATLVVEEETAKKGISLASNLDDTLYVGILYDSLFAIENLDHISGIADDISLTLQYLVVFNETIIKNESLFIERLNERKSANTGSFFPNQTGTYTITGSIENISIDDPNTLDNTIAKTVIVEDTSSIPCNISLSVHVNDTFYAAGEPIEFDFSTNDTFPFTIEYWIEDLFGTFYKNKINTTNLNEKSWKTDIDEEDRALFIKGNIYPSCDDVSSDDDHTQYLFIVTDRVNEEKKANQEADSRLEITDVKNDAIFGNAAEIEVSINKGDTRKYAIELWIEGHGKKVSEITKLKMPDKFSTFEGTLPIQLFDNCEKNLEDGSYDVIIEGLGFEDEEEIDIALRDCDSKTTTSAQKLVFKVLNSTNENNDVKTTVLLKNNQNTELDLDLWSYVYRGSKSYSGEREANKESFVLGSHEERIVTLHNTASVSELGMYKLKVLLNKNNQKTSQDITQDIEIQGQQAKFSEQPKTTMKSPTSSAVATIAPLPASTIIYESATQNVKNTFWIFLIVSSLLLNIILLFKL